MGVIGCGKVCEVKSVPGLQLADGSEVVAVMRRDEAKAADFAKRHNVPKFYGNANQLINDPDVDAVYIATPVGSHCELAMEVCQAGKPAYVEKPMTRNTAEARRMVEAFKTAHLPLFVAYYRRRLPRFLKAKELIETGQLGKITDVAYRLRRPRSHVTPDQWGWRVDAEQSGGGLIMDIGSHGIDILNYIVSPMVEVQGRAVNVASPINVEDCVVFNFVMENGALGSAMWNFASSVDEDRIEITGTSGQISMSLLGNEPVTFTTAAGQTQTFDLPNPPHIQQPLIQSMVDELRGLDVKCPSTGLTAMRTTEILDEVLREYYGSREDGFWQEH